MFRRFTRSARIAVSRAQEEAAVLGHGEVATEHLLLGLFAELGPVVAALEEFDVTSEEVRAQVHRVRGGGSEPRVTTLPFTPRAKRALEHALRESLAREDDVIGPEHILLGLLAEPDSGAARILRDFDVDAEHLRRAMTDELRGGASRPPFVSAEAGPASRYDLEGDATASARFGPLREESRQGSQVPIVVAIVLAAVSFPLGLLTGFLVWG